MENKGNAEMKTTLILGSTVIDMIVRVPHLPVTQEDLNTRSMTMALGGCAVSTSDYALLANRRWPVWTNYGKAFK